ncbi:MAG: hypothetical protein J6T22_11845 [Bacteroidales bacterium]|nr:hypothetical protein [Bacteroidales bacterium]
MSMTYKKLSSDKPQDRSDVLSLLNSIDGMCDACQHVLNTYTQTTLMLAITTEAKMLLMKLQVMKDRWNYHLPFKEACGVDFYDWSKRFDEVSRWMVGNDESGKPVESVPEYCPSKHFMLDLYTLLPENKPVNGTVAYYTETNATRLISVQERNRKQIAKNWKDYRPKFSALVVDALENEAIGEMLRPLAKQNKAICGSCSEVLQQLSKVLGELHDMPKGEIDNDQFTLLADRVVNEPEYGGVKAQHVAFRDFNHLKNTTPEDEWPRRCDDEINATGELLGEMKHGSRLFRFLGNSYIIKDHYAGFGRFLNSFRKEISEEELTNIIELLFRIHYLREDIEHRESADFEEAEPDEPSATAKDALSVYRRRKAMSPHRPPFSYIFTDKLVGNMDAINKYYEILHHCGFYIGRALLSKEKKDKEIKRYEGWKWMHLREALVDLGILHKDNANNQFAKYLAKVFPYLTEAGVLRGLNGRSTYKNEAKNERIVRDIVDEFRPVKDLLENRN